MCSCEQEKLPPPSIKNSILQELYDFFIEMEQEHFDKSENLMNEISDPTRRYIFKQVYESYRNADFENKLNTDSPLEKFANLIIKTNTLDTIGLYDHYFEIANELESIDEMGLIRFYLYLLIPKRFKKELKTNYQSFKIDEFSSKDNLSKLLELYDIQQHAAISHKDLERIDYHKYIFYLYGNTQKLENYIKLKSYLINDISRMYAVKDDGSYNEDNADFCAGELEKILLELNEAQWRIRFNILFNYIYLVNDFEKKIQCHDQLLDLADNEYVSNFWQEEMYVNLGLFLSESGSREDHKLTAIDYFNKALQISIKDPCNSKILFLLTYMNFLEDGNINELILKYKPYIDSCKNLNNVEKFYKLRIKEINKMAMCTEINDISACKECLKIFYSSDSLFNVLYEGQDELHLSDYYASSAHKNFLIRKLMLGFDEYNHNWKEDAFNLLQLTKFRIFNYQNNYDKIYPDNVLNKILYAEEKLSDVQTTVNDLSTTFNNEDIFFLLFESRYNLSILKEKHKGNVDLAIEDPVSIYNIQNLLSKMNAQLLEYYNYEDHLWVFGANPDTIFFEQIDHDSIFTWVDSIKISQQAYSNPFPDSISSAVYEIMLSPYLDSSFNNLIIIPDGKLTGLSFESIVTTKDHYLVNDYNISYAYGLNAIREFTTSQKKIKSAGFVSYSDERTISDYSKKAISELYGSLQEVKRCSEICSNLKTKLYTGYDCTSDNLKNIFKYDITHIATHAHSESSQNIGNYFYTRGKDTLDKVYGYEFDNLRCNSSLAILSACETGVGKFESGEGVFSLSRNLLKAGIPSVIKTLWQVDDISSGDLVTYFYENIESGVTLTEALTLAKRKFIQEKDHPYFWSSYVLEGNPFISFNMK